MRRISCVPTWRRGDSSPTIPGTRMFCSPPPQPWTDDMPDSISKPRSKMFEPLTLRGVTLPNRIVLSPMCMYSADDGLIGDFQLVHLGSRAIGGAGLILTEMTNVSPEGRISPRCAGMYKPEHRDAWKRVVDFVHANSDAKIGTQIAHAGRKASTP